MEILLKLLEHSPELAALVIVVLAFLKHGQTLTNSLKDMHSEHLDARKQSREAIERNTEMFYRFSGDIKENSEATKELTKTMVKNFRE
jgi:hypothetical protein